MKPMFPTYTIKNHAKMSMGGRFFKLAAVAFIPDFIILAIIGAFVLLVPGAADSLMLITKGNFETAEARFAYMIDVTANLSYALSAVSILFAFLSVGRVRVFLDAVRGREVKIKNIFCFYDKWYICSLYPLLMNGIYFGVSRLTDAMFTRGVEDAVVSAVNMLVLLLYYIVELKFVFIYPLLAEDNCKSFIGAVKGAWQMTGFNTVLNVITLSVSFLGWILLCGFVGPVIIYVYPYMQIAMVALYEANVIFRSKADADSLQ